MKQVLVPTDLTVRSLNIVHDLVRRNNETWLNIHLVHMVRLSSDISELLFTRKNHLYGLVSNRFTDSLQMLKNRYRANINSIGLQFFYGNHGGALRNIADSLAIDEICYYSDYDYTQPFTHSVNMIPFVKKCGVPASGIEMRGRLFVNQGANLLSSLFEEEYSASEASNLRTT